MTSESVQEPGFIERAQRTVARTGYGLVVAGLAVGLLLLIFGRASASATLLAATCGVLIGLPVLNVVAMLAEEIRRRDWTFMWLAATVLGLLVYNILHRL